MTPGLDVRPHVHRAPVTKVGNQGDLRRYPPFYGSGYVDIRMT
jgi:hypothetical protein